MKAVTQYKKKVIELYEKFNKKEITKNEYFKELEELDIQLIMEIRKEKNIPIYSAIF